MFKRGGGKSPRLNYRNMTRGGKTCFKYEKKNLKYAKICIEKFCVLIEKRRENETYFMYESIFEFAFIRCVQARAVFLSPEGLRNSFCGPALPNALCNKDTYKTKYFNTVLINCFKQLAVKTDIRFFF